jgi:Bax protein
MFRDQFSKLTFERFGIAFMGLCVAALFTMVATDDPKTDRKATLPAVAKDRPAEVRTMRPMPVAPVIPSFVKPVQVSMIGSSDKLSMLFKQIDYRLDGVRRHGTVPRRFLANLPSDLRDIRIAGERKVMFIKTALPLILHVNELILYDRDRIEVLAAKLEDGETLSADEQDWLAGKAEEYRLDKVDLAEMLRRVDIIPPSLALAQSAEESGWGTSRFAQQGNALFGQRIFKGTNGIVPKRRDKGKTHRVRTFSHLIEGVKSYARNLNGHPAYKKFRAVRARLRDGGQDLNGDRLARTLAAYSERGPAYVRTIRAIIRVNELHQYDKARLGNRVTPRPANPDA